MKTPHVVPFRADKITRVLVELNGEIIFDCSSDINKPVLAPLDPAERKAAFKALVDGLALMANVDLSPLKNESPP